jgi:hypothetical protein
MSTHITGLACRVLTVVFCGLALVIIALRVALDGELSLPRLLLAIPVCATIGTTLTLLGLQGARVRRGDRKQRSGDEGPANPS